MAIKITDECINCGACEPECPNTAIYEASYEWKYSDGTSLLGDSKLPNGKIANADKEHVNMDIFSFRFFISSNVRVVTLLSFMLDITIFL